MADYRSSALDTDAENGWEFVKPEPGFALVNMGDALVKLTNGIIRSPLHRVTYAPGAQATFDRYSLAYFSRPEDDVKMETLRNRDNTLKIVARRRRRHGEGMGSVQVADV